MKILHWLSCRLWGMAMLIVGLVLCPLLFAQETLTYEGAPMVGTLTGTAGPAGPFVTRDFGTIVLAQSLNPNEADQVVTPVSYAFDDSALLASTWSQEWDTQSFVFSTQNGNIIGWDIEVFSNFQGQERQTLSINSIYGDTYSSAFVNGTCVWLGTCGNYTAVSAEAGTLIDPPAAMAAPELSVSEFWSMATLLIGAALVLRTTR